MKTRAFALLIPLVTLAGCGGTTLRVADDDGTEGPVALAPAPAQDSAAPADRPPGLEPAAPPPSQGYAPYETSGDLQVRRIGQWAHTGIGEARRMVIRDANGFAQLWAELGAGDRPDVDFTQNVVIVAAAGERPSGGYEIAIDRVAQADGQLTIQVIETAPGPNCITAGGATKPVDVVVLTGAAPRGWSFLERKEIRPCR
ncbi:MAG TPA: protease complex subunit PrcB family protein [Gemmatimonadales bacterium]|nr:protease complex subunit PrcB family protein [Gemmatimonadales bacterium]